MCDESSGSLRHHSDRDGPRRSGHRGQTTQKGPLLVPRSELTRFQRLLHLLKLRQVLSNLPTPRQFADGIFFIFPPSTSDAPPYSSKRKENLMLKLDHFFGKTHNPANHDFHIFLSVKFGISQTF